MVHILIAEDDQNLQLLLRERLKPYYQIQCADNGNEALDIIYNQHIDCLVTDVMMPGMDGFRLLKTLRSEGLKLPVLILTAKQSFSDKRTGFTIGTDDYMTKPVNFDELHWRIDALLRRANISAERMIRIGDTVLNERSYTLSKKDTVIELPPKEFELIYKLLSYPGIIFTKNQLLDEIWGYDSESGEDTVKTHISRLRNRLSMIDDFRIVTIKGLGYKAEINEKGAP